MREIGNKKGQIESRERKKRGETKERRKGKKRIGEAEREERVPPCLTPGRATERGRMKTNEG